MKLLLLTLLLLGASDRAEACSGPSTRVYAATADVIVVGKVAEDAELLRDVLLGRRVIKGERASRYQITWPGVDGEDECAFLSPLGREKGVFFLRRRSDGAFDVIWTEPRWDRRWKVWR